MIASPCTKCAAPPRPTCRPPFRLMRADLAHIHMAAQTSLLRKLPFVFLARLLRKPVIVHVHAPSPESLFVTTRKWARGYVFRSATRVVALSESWAQLFRLHEPRARVIVMRNPAATHEARPGPGGAVPAGLRCSAAQLCGRRSYGGD